MTIQRRATRGAQKSAQEQINELASLAAEANLALGKAVDQLNARVTALEQALERARAKSVGTNGHGLIALP